MVPSGPPAPLLTGSAANCPPVLGSVENAEPNVLLFPLESLIGCVLSRCHHPCTVTLAELRQSPPMRDAIVRILLRIFLLRFRFCFLAGTRNVHPQNRLLSSGNDFLMPTKKSRLPVGR